MIQVQQNSVARKVPIPCNSGNSPVSGVTPTIQMCPVGGTLAAGAGTATSSNSGGRSAYTPGSGDFSSAGYWDVQVSGTGIDTITMTVLVTAGDPVTRFGAGAAGSNNGIALVGSQMDLVSAINSAALNAIAKLIYPFVRANYFVNGAGNDSTGDGLSPATAWATLDHAFASVTAPALIHLEGSPTAYYVDVSGTVTSYSSPTADLTATGGGTPTASDTIYFTSGVLANQNFNIAAVNPDGSGGYNVTLTPPPGSSPSAGDTWAAVLQITDTAYIQALAMNVQNAYSAATNANTNTATLTGRLTAARAGYLDNLNVGGAVASHADVVAINQSASKHLLLVTVGQYAPGETYTIEMRTFAAATGAAVNADTTPTLTATGNVSGNLSANLSAATNPATGVYRWTYTPGATPTLEQIRFDGSATISSATFTLAAYAQTVDEPSVVWTATDQSHLTAVYNKLPPGNLGDATAAAQTSLANSVMALGSPMQAGTAVQLAATQPNYAPAKAGDKMDLVNAPNATAIAAIQSGLATTTLANTINTNVLALPSAAAIVAGVLDVAASSHNTAGTIGAKINSAASAGDPWSTDLPGTYPSGTAGYIVGNGTGGGSTITIQQIVAALAGTTMTIVSPVGNGEVTVIVGSAYKAAYGNPLTFTTPPNANWPTDFTGWTNLRFTATHAPYNVGTDTPHVWSMTAPTPSGAGQMLQLELASTDTTSLTPGWGTQGYVFRITGTPPSSSDTVVLEEGVMNVKS